MKLPIALVLPLLLAPETASRGKPPTTRVETVRETLHGVELVDNYRWLEGDNSNPGRMGQVTPEVGQWTDAQNAHTRGVLDNLPGRKPLEERLRPLMEVGSVSRPMVRGDRYFYSKREGSQNQPVVYWRDGSQGEPRVLLDPARARRQRPDHCQLVCAPAWTAKRLAYGTYRAGDENTTLHLMEVDSGQTLPLEIPNKMQAPDWLPDGSGFVYHNLKDPKNPYSGRVLFHRMGTDPAQDPVLFRQYTQEENKKLATTWGPGGSLSRTGAGWSSATGSTRAATTCGWRASRSS